MRRGPTKEERVNIRHCLHMRPAVAWIAAAALLVSGACAQPLKLLDVDARSTSGQVTVARNGEPEVVRVETTYGLTLEAKAFVGPSPNLRTVQVTLSLPRDSSYEINGVIAMQLVNVKKTIRGVETGNHGYRFVFDPADLDGKPEIFALVRVVTKQEIWRVLWAGRYGGGDIAMHVRLPGIVSASLSSVRGRLQGGGSAGGGARLQLKGFDGQDYATRPGADGSWEIPNVPAGKYTLLIDAHRSTPQGGGGSYSFPVDVPSGRPGVDLGVISIE
jgi:hypothetical protein